MQHFGSKSGFLTNLPFIQIASSILPCISSALADLQLLENLGKYKLVDLIGMKLQLGKLRTFLQCARKCCSKDIDATTLGALVIKMEKTISKWGQRIHNFYLATLKDGSHLPFSKLLPFVKEIRSSFDYEINRWYMVFSDRSSRMSLLEKDDLMEFIDSVVEHLKDIFRSKYLLFDYNEKHEAIREMLMFSRNFICFVRLHGLERRHLEPLLYHAESVTLCAASLCFALCSSNFGKYIESFRDLPKKIIGAEREVHEFRVQALIASKLSTQSFQEADHKDLFEDFVDSLLFYLWHILKTEACLMILLKDQLQMLWEGLISLRSILRGKPEFDEKMRDLTRLSLCDAGLVVFSLFSSVMQEGLVKHMDLVCFKDFIGRLEVIKATIAEKGSEPSSSNFPRTDVLGFLDSLVNYMSDVSKSEDAGSIALVNYPISIIREELDFLRSNFMEKIVEMHHEDEELQALWNRVVEVAYKVEFLIDSLLVGGVPDSCSMLFDAIMEEIMIVKADTLKILDDKRLDHKVKEVTKKFGHISLQGSKPITNNAVVGLEDEATSIINRLTRGSTQLRIVPIVGMPGLGKTTLARKVYNDSTILSSFYTRAWCTISQVFHKKRVLLEILTCIRSEHPKDFSEMCEEDLALEVKKGLQRTRYLIVLDDAWDTEVWNDLEALFPDNRNGSRVILTSRRHDIIGSRDDLSEGPHYLRPLTPDESWDLLNLMLYPEKENLPSPELSELWMQIVEMCQGLPLTIVILAGLLANEDQYCWERVVKSVNSSSISSTEQCTATLKLSYQNLPDNLKSCFLYFGAFPGGHEHTVEDLTCLWVAEGFVQESQFKSAEDVAYDYMMGLIGWSLVIVSKQSSLGGVEACRVHDLLHEFCVRKGTKSNFCSLYMSMMNCIL